MTPRAWTPEAINKLREQHGLTQEELAHAIGVTVSTVNRWENGHIVPSRLAALALAAVSDGRG